MNCCVCGNKMNLFEGETFPGEIFLLTCPECSKIIKRLEYVRENSDDRNEYFDVEAELNSRYNMAEHDSNFEKNYGNFLKDSRTEFRQRNTTEEERNAEVVYTDPENTFMKTSGFGFEGYKITKYLDVVSVESVLINFFYNNLFSDPEELSGKLQSARDEAMEKFVAKCVEKGANAAIGVDFNYVSFSANNANFVVIAHGTAVKIEPLS